MFEAIKTLFTDKIEFSMLVTLITGFAILVGDNYYAAYFASYNIPHSSISLNILDHARIFLLFLIIFLVIYLPTLGSNKEKLGSISEAMLENIPIFFLLLMGFYISIEFYWNNVNSLSILLMKLKVNSDVDVPQAVDSVNTVLRSIIIIVPIVFSCIATMYFSVKKISVSNWLTKTSVRNVSFISTLLVTTYLFGSTLGTFHAYAERSQFIKMPLVEIITTDGKKLTKLSRMILVGSNPQGYFISKIMADGNYKVSTVFVPITKINLINYF